MKIEKYLKQNRLKLDAETPNDDFIWKGIKKEIRPQRTILPDRMWKTAAIFLLGVLLTYVVVKENQEDSVVIVTLADISQDLGQQEAELKRVVNKKWEEIQPLTMEEKSEFGFLLDELNELDKVYKTYEQDLNKTDGNEQIINALLDYYEKKIRLLNRLSMEIEKQKNYETTIELKNL
ncbi:hypothetical protein [Maribellus maritimus]|uniref:hypothetical protein n=1 Tax=Maribellus maritimus TaxID=2870838 RepID=UPI001EEAF382|nr:hypothetical protein [Maribellus maritimus]MCG6191193.1 hypothetical protein [Maribellus maritimus]